MAGFQTPTTRKPTTFHSFRFLAPEIRIKIWEYLLPGPRLVEVTFDLTRNIFLEWSEPVSIHLVQVNEEARDIVFRKYFAFFGTEIQSPRIYANPKIDIFRLNWDAFHHWKITDCEFSNIHHLELADKELHTVSATRLMIHLSAMPNLKQLTVLDPRSPFIVRPLPAIPAVPTPEAVLAYFIARGEYQMGQALEARYAKVWKVLVKVDGAARIGLYDLPNLAVGMVGVVANGERRFKMVRRKDHSNS
jgi:hypothetical protein